MKLREAATSSLIILGALSALVFGIVELVIDDEEDPKKVEKVVEEPEEKDE